MNLIPSPQLEFNVLPVPPPPNTQTSSCSTFTPPPLDGSLTFPELYDWHYHHTPDHPVFVYPEEDGRSKDVNWPEVVRAVHTGARLLQRDVPLKTSSGGGVIVAIFATSDTITYFTLIVATIRAGFIPFLLSPRNSPAAIAHLLSATTTNHVLVGSEPALQDVLQAALRLLQNKYPDIDVPGHTTVPRPEDIFTNNSSFELLPPYRPELNSLAIIFHSSGSTAFPKPIGWTHLQLVQLCLVPYFGERDLTGAKVSCHALPMFHGMGMAQTAWTASMGIIVTAARPQSPPVPPTPDKVLMSAKATSSEYIFCVPTFIEAWSRDDSIVDYLSRIKGIIFGGGPLNKKVGDIMARRGVTIFNIYGSSEAGVISTFLPRHVDLDWEYFSVTKQLNEAYIPNGHGQYELVLSPTSYQILSVYNGQLDGRDAYYTGDLFVAHPTKPGHYKIFGRSDDQIMHSTGEKTNPWPLETILTQDPHVKAAVMFGRERFNVGVIVEPTPAYRFDPTDTDKLAEFRNVIWPTVERMNAYAPQHSRLFKEMILVASLDKPFEYTGKNTPRRQRIINNYELEIGAIYRSVAETTQAEIEPPEVWDMETCMPFVRKVVQSVLRTDLGDSEDLFQHGCDSLQATWIRNTILRAIHDSTRISTNRVEENIVYQFPSIEKLASFTAKLASKGLARNTSSYDDKLVIQNMLEMADRFSENFSKRSDAAEPASTRPDDAVFLVIGTTGSLGASLLYDLLKSRTVRRVYALNRAGTGASSLLERQKSAFQNLELPLDILAQPPERLVLVEADTADVNAGLTPALLEEIRSSVTHIILNAWPVDFNFSLQSFEPSIKAVRNLIDIALSSYRPKPPSVTFVSSIGVLARYNGGGSDALEIPATPDEASTSGYSQAKWVAETILLNAARCTTLRVRIVRIGQLTGGTNGYWKKTDWVPAVIKSSRSIGCFPSFESDKVISWVPVDAASQALLELAQDAHRGQIFHLVHPNPVSSSIVSQTVSSKLNIPLTSFSDWLNRLEESAVNSPGNGDDLHAIPALRMPHFFRSLKAGPKDGREAWAMPSLDISASRKSSTLMGQGSIRQITEGEVYKWLQKWFESGFL